MENINRRHFVKNASIGSFSAASIGLPTIIGTENKIREKNENPKNNGSLKPREVWIATLTLMNIHGKDFNETVNAALKQMENAIPFSPDIYCLPENFLNTEQKRLEIYSEDGSGRIIRPFQEFAKKHHCYIICPVNTLEKGKYYNAAILIDRQGKNIGQYRKIRLIEPEIDELGLTPGPLDVPVFETDFGIIGIQICFDIEYPDAWRMLGKKGAEIVFWPSAFAAGKMLNAKAWENQYCVVSSTHKNTTKICDITGEEVAVSGNWSDWGVCAPVNLEKAFLHSWPYSDSFPAVQKKYGRKIKIHSLHEEEFSVIESLSPEVKVADIMREFKFKTYREHMQSAEEKQKKYRI